MFIVLCMALGLLAAFFLCLSCSSSYCCFHPCGENDAALICCMCTVCLNLFGLPLGDIGSLCDCVSYWTASVLFFHDGADLNTLHKHAY